MKLSDNVPKTSRHSLHREALMKAIVNRMTVNQKKAMETEIRKQIGENLNSMSSDLISIVLWQLHEQLGFGKKRLLRFYKSFAPSLRALVDYYDLPDNDQGFICNHQLKAIGIDVDKMTEAFTFKAKIE